MAKLQMDVPAGTQNIISVATINASLDKVFQAHVQVELFRKWFGRGNELDVHAFDAKDGGVWHITEKSEEGEFAFYGTFHEVAKNTRIIQTFEYMGMPERGHVILQTSTFTQLSPDRTEIRTVSTFQSQEDLRGMVDSGMEEGYRQSMYALGKVVGDTEEE